MVSLDERIEALAARTSDAWRPTRFELAADADRAELERLFAAGRIHFCHDTLLDQLRDLVAASNPSCGLQGDALDAEVRRHLGGTPPALHGPWFLYPWSGRLVHLLPESEYVRLRTDRNRNKISADEQVSLREKRIGIVGASVGNTAAVTLAIEGVGGAFRIADFDTVALSNLNRLRVGAHQLGVNKAVLTAREIAEIDPYLDVTLLPDGLADATLDDFLLDGGKLDLIVEGCDDLYMKVRLRERARELGIPVIMNTSDRGLSDVERFDLEPDRPVLHGLLQGRRAEELRGLTTREKIPHVMQILGAEQLSPAAAASLVEVGETISTWPQLASSVTMDGGLAANIARRILLGSFRDSGRFYVDAEAIVRDGGGVELGLQRPRASTAAACTTDPPPVPLPPEQTGPVTEEEVRFLVAHAVLAPSGGNYQPWIFRWAGGRLLCSVDAARAMGFLDWNHCGSVAAVGSAVENLVVAARALGLYAEVEPLAGPGDDVCAIRLTREGRRDPQGSSLDLLRRRATNRRLGPRRPLADDDAQALISAAALGGGRLHLLRDEGAIAEMGRVIGDGDRVWFLSRRMFDEMMGEMRWTREEVLERRDGLDVATLELSPADAAGLKLMASWPVMAHLRRIGAGQGLGRTARNEAAAAGAFGLLTVPGVDRRSWFRGGRSLERMWLAATARGLAVHPHSALPYLFVRLSRGGGEGLADDERSQLTTLRGRWLRLFPGVEDDAEIVLFRVGYAEPPTARSVRRPVEDVLRVGP